jgi:RNA polymerase sigma-70 factor (TIGR02957 family)
VPLFADGLAETLPARFRKEEGAGLPIAGRGLPCHKYRGYLVMTSMDSHEFAEHRPLMFSIAYRMTGSVGDAEDVVQEAFLRAAADTSDIAAPKAYLATITTRLAIDHLRSARVRRESYVGTWLPEPLVTDQRPGPAEHAEMSDSLSMAFLLLLENLSPAERAVFLLREVFGYGYDEIAATTGKSEPACRQLFARARRGISQGRPRYGTSRADAQELTSIFLDVAAGADVGRLLDRLAPDVVFYGDSGGKGEATFSGPVFGRERVAEILTWQVARSLELGGSLRPAVVNGQVGMIASDVDGLLVAVMTYDVLDGQLQAIRVVANPDKIRHIGQVSESWHLRASE